MKRAAPLATTAFVVLLAALPALEACSRDPHSSGGHGSHHHDDEHDELERGPNGGRLLEADGFSVEVTIHERNTPPRFRVYPYADGEPIPPEEAEVSIELARLGGRIDSFRLHASDAYLTSESVVEEPHSFDVTVHARWRGRRHRWQYPSYEGRVELSSDAARASGIEVETAGPAPIVTTLDLYGRVVPNEDRMVHVIPRYPGIVKKVNKRLGDRVESGEVLAVIESNESLETYPVVSELTGTVILKHVAPGEFVEQDEEIYIVADLETVWVDFSVYRRDFSRLRVGQEVTVDGGEGAAPARGTITYVSPFGAESTQSMLARTELDNLTGAWKPGLFVSGRVVLEETEVPVAVRTRALQRLRDWEVVFVRVGDIYEARPVEVGRRSGGWAEILSGLEAGEEYVHQGSFVLKADLEKSAAAHHH